MRYAICSDIHANLQAWNAVLLDIRSSNIDAIISLGDLIGYGPNPIQVLESIYANIDHFVLGNHDAVVCGKMDDALFNDRARELIAWTRSQLGREAARFLRKLPLSLDGGSFRCAHGDFSEPAAFNYVIDPHDALASWEAVSEPLLFVGHTHHPAIFLLGPSGTPHRVGPQDFVVEDEKRYLVNVGSIGQPRDGDARSTYCIYDTLEQSVCWRRVPFDIDAYRGAMEQAGLDPETSYFLRHDPRKALPPLREMLNFSPAQTPEQGARNAVPVQELDLLTRSRDRWRKLFLVVLLLALTAGGAAGTLWWRHHSRAREIPGMHMAQLNAVTAAANANLLSVPTRPTKPGQPLRGWTVQLGNRHRQTAFVAGANEDSALVLTSRAPKDKISIASPRIRVNSDLKLTAHALFHKSPDFDGNAALYLAVQRNDDGRTETLETFISKEPNLRRINGWLAAQQTKDLPAGSTSVQFAIRGSFTGTVRLRDLQLVKKE